MPVVKQAQVAYTLMSVFFDVPSATVVATFCRQVDGQELPHLEFRLEGADVAPLLIPNPDATKSRRDDITDAVYAMAIAKGVISGEVV